MRSLKRSLKRLLQRSLNVHCKLPALQNCLQVPYGKQSSVSYLTVTPPGHSLTGSKLSNLQRHGGSKESNEFYYQQEQQGQRGRQCCFSKGHKGDPEVDLTYGDLEKMPVGQVLLFTYALENGPGTQEFRAVCKNTTEWVGNFVSRLIKSGDIKNKICKDLCSGMASSKLQTKGGQNSCAQLEN